MCQRLGISVTTLLDDNVSVWVSSDFRKVPATILLRLVSVVIVVSRVLL